jgi:hypothetical protein
MKHDSVAVTQQPVNIHENCINKTETNNTVTGSSHLWEKY